MKKILIVILLMFTVSSCASSPAKMPQWKADSMSPEAREKADALEVEGGVGAERWPAAGGPAAPRRGDG